MLPWLLRLLSRLQAAEGLARELLLLQESRAEAAAAAAAAAAGKEEGEAGEGKEARLLGENRLLALRLRQDEGALRAKAAVAEVAEKLLSDREARSGRLAADLHSALAASEAAEAEAVQLRVR